MNKIIVSPSILAADFAKIGDELRKIEDSGAPWAHLDVMDGNFVPNLTFGPPLISSFRAQTQLFFDVHLMINNPNLHIDEYIKAGCDCISFHYEALRDSIGLLKKIKSMNKKCGISIKPATPAGVLGEVLPFIDLALIMTVNPGFGGQEIIADCLEKVNYLAKIREEKGLDFRISVDGGINRQTGKTAIKAGADVLVMGSAFFMSDDRKGLVQELQN